jgi:hypothetical protein
VTNKYKLRNLKHSITNPLAVGRAHINCRITKQDEEEDEEKFVFFSCCYICLFRVDEIRFNLDYELAAGSDRGQTKDHHNYDS